MRSQCRAELRPPLQHQDTILPNGLAVQHRRMTMLPSMRYEAVYTQVGLRKTWQEEAYAECKCLLVDDQAVSTHLSATVTQITRYSCHVVYPKISRILTL